MEYNGKMVRLARDSRSLSQDELSKLVGEPQTAISAVERNGTNDINVITKIANALRYPIRLFEFNDSINRLSVFYYRKRESFPGKLITELEAKMDIIRKSYDHLLKGVEVNYKGLPAMPATDDKSVEEIAKFARLYFRLDDGPIDNPINLIEKIGIPVLLFDVPSDKFSGITIHTDSNLPIIVLNKNMPNDHQKYTLFHEIGHLIMHVPFTDSFDFYEKYSKDKDVIEHEADRFASAFLMPATKAKATFGYVNYSRLTELKLYWKVSKQAILRRAKDLGIITPEKYKYIYIELSRNGERKKESISISIDKPALTKKLVNVYTEHLGYTMKEIAEGIACLKEDDFANWLGIEEPPLFTININYKKVTQ